MAAAWSWLASSGLQEVVVQQEVTAHSIQKGLMPWSHSCHSSPRHMTPCPAPKTDLPLTQAVGHWQYIKLLSGSRNKALSKSKEAKILKNIRMMDDITKSIGLS